MHIVALTGHYHPFMKPPERCINPFLENLSEEHKLEIICPVYDRRYKDDFKKGNIIVHFVDGFPNKIKSYIQTNRTEKKSIICNDIIFWLYRALRFFFSWVKINAYEDSSMVKPILKRAEEINRNHRIDIIISVSLPFYSHVAALEYKKKHPDVRWITFTTDPLAYNEANPTIGYMRNRAISIEQRIYESCDYCIVTEELYPNLTDDFKINPSKILKLPFLLTSQPMEDHSKQDAQSINILYAGYLYYKIRNPKLMMDSISYLDNVNFNLFVAGDRHCRKYLAGDFPHNYHINGLVPRDKYLEILTWNDVFVNLSNTIRLQAPSKLLELISTGKPVVNFYHHQDSGYYIVERYPLGINISCELSAEEIAKHLKHFINRNAKLRIDYAKICAIFPDYLLGNQLPVVRNVILGTI